MTQRQFSSALRKELAIALNEYMTDPARGEQRVRNASDLVCTEAHAMHMTADQLVLSLRRLYAELAGGRQKYVEDIPWRAAFHALLEGCVRSFFAASAATPKPAV